MLYKSEYPDWAVAQCKDFRYVYLENDKYSFNDLDCKVNEVTTSLMPIGPTILVEWEE